MTGTREKMFSILVACGTAAGVAQAQPFAVNGSGATLQEAFFEAAAATNDFIDVDGDGIAPEQLATFDLTFPFVSTQHWQFTYRVVGSVNGFSEMRDWGTVFATAADNSAANITLNSDFSDRSIINRTDFVIAGVRQGTANSANPGGQPFRSLTNGSYAITTGTGAGTGVQIDFSALDVPVSWAVRQDVGTPVFNRVPGAPGYGSNPRIAVNKDGSPAGFDNQLASLTGPESGVTLNVNTSSPNANTVFDTLFALAPVASPVNFGVGLREIDMSDLRHLFATGRRESGENLVAITRDSGSGTRNAFANGIALDPSWAVGENIGERTVSSTNDRLGPNFQPSNKGGSSRMDATVRNHRLAVGFTGAERGESNGWLVDGDLELLAINGDIRGNMNGPARPTIENVLSGAYEVVGPAAIATIGDPRADLPSLGGFGFDPSEMGAYINNQPPRNPQVSAFVNNITRSIDAFTEVPGGSATDFSPGEFLATQFVLPASADVVLTANPDPMSTFIPQIANTVNTDLQNFVLGDSGNVLALSAYASFNENSAGIVPNRTTGVNYTDAGLPGQFGDNYVTEGGDFLFYGTSLGNPNTNAIASRNLIAGDFDGDGVRSADDIMDLVAAWQDRNGGPQWTADRFGNSTNNVSIELIGDFTGDGNFDAEDVRYFADGLALVSGSLDRNAGFSNVDMAFGGNFFGTTLATGASYTSGDSRGDIAGNLTARGWNPIGADGIVNAQDIDYVCANFGDWADLTQAVEIDLSADMNGDLVVDTADVTVIVEDILDTTFGDVNLDGVVDDTDLMIATANLGMMGGWAEGDMNCDGMITQADLDIIGGTDCPADFNGDDVADFFDVQAFLAAFSANDPSSDLTMDGIFDFFDVQAFLNAFSAGCP